jgi:hypothetical protein
MKYKDFLTKLKDNGRINQAEFLAAIESAPDAEFPDKAFEAFEESFMTLDRASSHPSVNTKLRAELLDPIDLNIKKTFETVLKDHIDPANVHVINSEKNTYKKFEAMISMLPKVMDKLKTTPGTDEETKKKLTSLEDTKKELLQRIEAMTSEYSEKEKTLTKDYESKFSSYKLDGELEKLSNKYTLAEAYEKTRPAITKVLLADLRAKHSLSLGEKDGQTEIQVTDKDGKPKFLENSNTQVTISSLLDSVFEPFVKKNNSESQDSSQTRSQDTQQRFSVDKNQTTARQGTRTTVK